MSNTPGNALVLTDSAGLIADGGQKIIVIGITLKSALTGILNVTGVVNSSGSPVAWSIPAGSTGFVAPPGAGHCGGLALSYAYVNPGADSGKAVAMTCLS